MSTIRVRVSARVGVEELGLGDGWMKDVGPEGCLDGAARWILCIVRDVKECKFIRWIGLEIRVGI